MPRGLQLAYLTYLPFEDYWFLTGSRWCAGLGVLYTLVALLEFSFLLRGSSASLLRPTYDSNFEGFHLSGLRYVLIVNGIFSTDRHPWWLVPEQWYGDLGAVQNEYLPEKPSKGV
jgi:hypothetical protein